MNTCSAASPRVQFHHIFQNNEAQLLVTRERLGEKGELQLLPHQVPLHHQRGEHGQELHELPPTRRLKNHLQLVAVLWIRIRVRIRNPDPHPNIGRAKITNKNRKKLLNFIFWSAGCSLLRAECFSCTLDQCCGTVTIYYGSGSGSDFWKVRVPVSVPVPTFEKLLFRFRFLLLKKLRFRFQFQLHI